MNEDMRSILYIVIACAVIFIVNYKIASDKRNAYLAYEQSMMSSE